MHGVYAVNHTTPAMRLHIAEAVNLVIAGNIHDGLPITTVSISRSRRHWFPVGCQNDFSRQYRFAARLRSAIKVGAVGLFWKVCTATEVRMKKMGMIER